MSEAPTSAVTTPPSRFGVHPDRVGFILNSTLVASGDFPNFPANLIACLSRKLAYLPVHVSDF